MTVTPARRCADGDKNGLRLGDCPEFDVKFKPALADMLVAHLAPIADETRRLLADTAHVDAVLRDGAERAAGLADPIVAEVMKLVGFL